MNLKISGALVAVSAALFSTSSNAALLFDPYIGLGFGIGSATIFVDDDNATDNAQSFSATAGFDIPILRVELEYDYMTPKDTKLHLGLINAYAKLPTTTIQPYIGAGIGPYMRDSHDRYVESRLVFGERVFIGKNIGNDWHIEFFTQHFSNGDFTEINRGFNFTGLSVSYSF